MALLHFRCRSARDPFRRTIPKFHSQALARITTHQERHSLPRQCHSPRSRRHIEFRGLPIRPPFGHPYHHYHHHAGGSHHGLVDGIGRLVTMTLSDGDIHHGHIRRDHALADDNAPHTWHKSHSISLHTEIVLQTLCSNGQLDDGVDALSHMDTAPSKSVYISLLKLCSKRKALNQAERVRAHLFQHGLELDSILGDHLVVTLANCGAVEDACDLLYKLPHHTVFSWTAIISAFTEHGLGQDALKMHAHMQEHGVQPSSYTFVILFKACSSIPDLKQGKELHCDAHKRGLTSVIFVGNCIVSMYGKCGAVLEAEHVFGGMLQRDVVSWNSMLSMYVQHNEGEKALLLYRQMQEEGVNLDQHTLVFSLQACGTLVSREAPTLCREVSTTLERQSIKLLSLEIGQALHADADKKHMSSDVFVGTALFSMYAKVGNDVDVEYVFGTLSHHDIVSWNAMISAYIEQGQGEKALLLYRQMQEEGMNPNQLTFVVALKACGTIAEKQQSFVMDGHVSEAMPLQIGRALHTDAQMMDFGSDTFFGTGLLSMYGKCGSVLEAEDLFSTLSERDIVSWNVLISTYVQQGQGEKALRLYRQMQEEGVCSDKHTLVSALQACGILAEKEEAFIVEGRSVKMMPLEIGQALHATAYRKDLTSDVFVSNTLVSMYGKCGNIVAAEVAFGALLQHDAVSWNSMLSAYIQLGLVGKALQSYRRMLEEEIIPDQLTYVIFLQACGILAEKDEAHVNSTPLTEQVSYKIGKALHEDIRRKGYETDTQVVNTLVSMYGKCGTIYEAELIFSNFPQRGVVSWTAMLSAYVEQGQGEKALQLFSQMQEEGVTPNHLTFVIALQACSILAEKEEPCIVKGRPIKVLFLEIGGALHTQAAMTGYDSEILVGTLLVSMYGKCGAIAEAEGLFFSLPQKDINIWNAMLSINVAQGQGDNALQLYAKLKEEDISVDDVTYLSILQACSETGSFEVCNEIYFHLVCAGYDWISSMAATLIHTYGSCASSVEVDVLLDGLPNPDVVSLTACISCHAGEGSLTASEHVLEELRLGGIKPDGVLFTSILSACSHAGLVMEGLDYFASMMQDHGITPTLRHFSTMVDLLGRAGDFKRVVDILEKMPFQDDLSFWLCLLGACRLHSNIELAKQAFSQAVKLHPKQAAAYVLMSNVYADAEFQGCIANTEN